MKSVRFALVPVSLALILASTPSAALAGNGQEGHGGNAIVCFDRSDVAAAIEALPRERRIVPNSALSHVVSIQALDLYEAARKAAGIDSIDGGRPAELFPARPGEPNSSYLLSISLRYENAVPLVARELRASLAAIEARTNVYSGDAAAAGIAQAYDTGELAYVIDARRCVIATLARQSGSRAAGTLRLDVDGRLMNHPKHSDLSRKAILLHELVYAWGRDRNQTTSEPTRLLVAKLLRKRTTRAEIVDVLVHYGFANPMDPLLHGERRFDAEIAAMIRELTRPAFETLGGRDFSAYSPPTADDGSAYSDLAVVENAMRIATDELARANTDLAGARNGRSRRDAKRRRDAAESSLAKLGSRADSLRVEVAALEKKKAAALAQLDRARVELGIWADSTLMGELDRFAGGSCFALASAADRWKESLRSALDRFAGLDPREGAGGFARQIERLAPVCDGLRLPNP